MRPKSLSDITFQCSGTEYEAAGRLIEQHRPHTDTRSDTLAICHYTARVICLCVLCLQCKLTILFSSSFLFLPFGFKIFMNIALIPIAFIHYPHGIIHHCDVPLWYREISV